MTTPKDTVVEEAVKEFAKFVASTEFGDGEYPWSETVFGEQIEGWLHTAIERAWKAGRESVIDDFETELTRLEQVRILIPKNVGGKSKCITEGYHRCLDKVRKFIKSLTQPTQETV